MAKPKLKDKTALDMLLRGVIGTTLKKTKKIKRSHTGRVDIDVTGNGQTAEFKFEDAVKLLRAKSYAENRAAAAEAAETLADGKTGLAELAAKTRDTDRAIAQKAKTEAELASTSSEGEAKKRLAEEAYAKAEISQTKFQTLDEEAARARTLALRRREEADQAADKLTAIETETNADERAKIIDRAIEEAEAKAVAIEYEERAFETVEKLSQATEAYVQAMRAKRQEIVDITTAKRRLARAELNEKRPGANREETAKEVAAAQADLEKLETLHKAANKPIERARASKNRWAKIADDLLAEQALSSSQRESLQTAKEASEKAADTLALDKANQRVDDIVTKLDRNTALYDKAGLEMEEARLENIAAQEALHRAKGDEVEGAQERLKAAAEAYEKARKLFLARRSTRVFLREEAQKVLANGVNDVEREMLEAAINAGPVVSFQERMLESIVERDEIYTKIAQAQQNWRQAVANSQASDDPTVALAAQELQAAKDALEASHSGITSLQHGIRNTLNNPHLSADDRDILETVLATAKETNTARQAVYVLDALEESYLKGEANILAKREAREAWEKAKRNLEKIKSEGGDIIKAQGQVDATKAILERAEARCHLDDVVIRHWEERHEALIPDAEVIANRFNEDAVNVTTRLESVIGNRPNLILARDQAQVAKITAATKLQELELKGANEDALRSAREEIVEAEKAYDLANSRIKNNELSIELWSQRADSLLARSDKTVLETHNQVRLQEAVDQASNQVSSPAAISLARVLLATKTQHNLNYDAATQAQRKVQEAREYLALARGAGDEGEVKAAEIVFKEAMEALKEAEKDVGNISFIFARWERQATQLLAQEDLPAADRKAIQDALNEAKQVKETRDPEFIRNTVAEKKAQTSDALEELNAARAIRDTARTDLERVKATGVQVDIDKAQKRFDEAQNSYEIKERNHLNKSRVYKDWKTKAQLAGVLAGAAALVTNPDSATASTIKPKKLGDDTIADQEARKLAQIRTFVETNNQEWREAKQEYEIAKKAVFPHGTDSDEALGYINEASLEEMEALNQATLRLEKAELLVQAQTGALIEARQESRKETGQREAVADHRLMVQHTDANLRQAQEKLEEVTNPVEELKALVIAEERLAEAKTKMAEAEAGAVDIAAMQKAATSFGISAEELANSQKANEERLVAAKIQLREAEANNAALKAKQKIVLPEGVDSKELLVDKQVQQRVQEAKFVAATVAVNKAEDLYVKERVRLKREDPEEGLGEWSQEVMATREKRDAQRHARQKKADEGIVEPISKEEKGLRLGYDPKTGVYTNFDEVPFANLVAKFEDKIDLADPRFLIELIKNYEKLTWEQKLVVDEILTPEVREFALVAYNVQEAHKERNDIELDQRASNDLHSSYIIIPDQKGPEPKTGTRVAETSLKPKELGGSKARQDVWQSLNKEQTPASQNFTPNVSESPNVDVEVCESGGQYETAINTEESMEQTSTSQLTPKVTVPAC